MNTTYSQSQSANARLKRWMLDAGFRTQTQLGQRAEVHQATISNLFGGKIAQPDLEIVRRLARALGRGYDDLIALLSRAYAENHGKNGKRRRGRRSRQKTARWLPSMEKVLEKVLSAPGAVLKIDATAGVVTVTLPQK